MSEVTRGSCLCGGIRFEISGRPAPWYAIRDDLPQYPGEPPVSIWSPEHEPR